MNPLFHYKISRRFRGTPAVELTKPH